MDDLAQLMEQLDLISKSIPEGNYLKMCNIIKNIHQDIRNRDPPAVDTRRPSVSIPFMPMIPTDVDDFFPDENIEYNEGAEDQVTVNYIEEQIRIKEKQLKLLKIRRNITEVVKRDAVKEIAEQLGFRLTSYTMENLRLKGVRITNERLFYKSYIDRQNDLSRGARTDLEIEIQELRYQIL
ncbi:MAG: hypothetical protein O3A99_09850 [Proteobacteria bacterium]|nr:hypothetical protein [Pseudomonadota bacterium]